MQNKLNPSPLSLPEKLRIMDCATCRHLSYFLFLFSASILQFKAADHLLSVVRYANKTIIHFSLLTDITISQKQFYNSTF